MTTPQAPRHRPTVAPTSSSPGIDRARLAIFSPLPPLENGIADYAAELIPFLSRTRDVTVVIDDHAPMPPPDPAYRVIRLEDYVAHADEFHHVDHLYQVGNNGDHVYLLPWLLRRPGVVVLHDVSLHHLIDQATLRHGDVDGYCALLELETGAPGRVLADQFRKHGWRPRSMFYEMPLTREMLGRARAVIAHSLLAVNKITAQQPDVPAILVRHHLSPKVARSDLEGRREAARAALGVPEDMILLVSLGFVTRAKQIDTVLRFLHQHRASLPAIKYIVAGEALTQEFDIHALISKLGLRDIVEVTGYVHEAAFHRFIQASDIVVNLRYPSGGETSGTLVRALGAGACVVVNDIGSFSEFPDDVCAKVPIDRGVADIDLARVLRPLIESQSLRRQFGANACDYIRRNHSIEESARRYLRALDEHGQRPVLALAEFAQRAFLPLARRERLLGDIPRESRGAVPLWAAEGLVPCRMASNGDRAIIVGAGGLQMQLLRTMFGYGSGDVDVVTLASLGDRPVARRSHSLAIVEMEVARHDAMLQRALLNLNARLRLDGTLLLTVVEESGSEPSNVVERTRRTLDGHGFDIERVMGSRETLSFVLDADGREDVPAEPTGIATLFQARKYSEFISPSAATETSAATHSHG